MANKYKIKIIQIKSGIISAKRIELMEKMKSFASLNNYEYDLITDNQIKEAVNKFETRYKKWWDLHVKCGYMESNFIKFYLASLNPDMLYADNDVEFLKAPIFSSNKSYFGKENQYISPNPSLFYVNNNCMWFSKLLEESMLRIPSVPYKKGWADIVARKYISYVDIITSDYFIHYRRI